MDKDGNIQLWDSEEIIVGWNNIYEKDDLVGHISPKDEKKEIIETNNLLNFVEFETEIDCHPKITRMIDVLDTIHFGRRSGFGEGRGILAEDKKQEKEEKTTKKKGGGGQPPVKTDDKDLKKIKRARSIIVGIEETRNDYSAEVIVELKRICASAVRMIEEDKIRKSSKYKKSKK